MSLDNSIAVVDEFRDGSLRDKLAHLERSFSEIQPKDLRDQILSENINFDLLSSAFTIKRASAQINVIIHSLGILLSLPHIMEPGEKVLSLSLGAGNTGKAFDLETDQRIAEYKFIQWQGGPEAIRQNSIFKDFFYLAEASITKSRYLYLLELERPLNFFNGSRSLTSVFSRNKKLNDDFQRLYENRFEYVHQYFEYRRSLVNIIDLRKFVPDLNSIISGLDAGDRSDSKNSTQISSSTHMERKVGNMAYYIYENWQAGPHKAVIHHGSCGHCKDGKGRSGGYDPSHALWHGPFGDLKEARSFSKTIEGAVDHNECSICIK